MRRRRRKVNKRLPVVNDLLLRAQGRFHQEQKARQTQDSKWRWVAITIVGTFSITFLVWLWVTELRADARMHYITGIQDAVRDLEVSLDDTKEIIQLLIARDIQREEEVAALSLQIRMGSVPSE